MKFLAITLCEILFLCFGNNIENENVKWKSLIFILNCDEQLSCF